jgi:uncharacterized membrane protein YphA (DoxX/SURF4 family)
MLDFFTSPYFLLFARLCLGGVFVVSGIAKWLDKPGTEASMSRYMFLPVGSGKIIANVFPPLEVAVGLLLIFGLFTAVAALVAAAMYVLFTGLIIYDLSRGTTQACNCFGRLSDEKLTPMAVVRNVALLALALLVFAGTSTWLSLDAAFGINRPGTSGDANVVVPIVILATLTVAIIAFGGRAVSMVRNTLNGLGFR